ncbi:MAG TPA: hypothetical protein VFG69_13695 [Nannocystaceae bacterium]|nr:hypothetical protein [Nannocystaceae bacterium]
MKPIRRPLASCRLLALPFVLGLATTPLAGCPKPEEKYENFLDETKDEREDAANMKMDVGGSLADVNGFFLFALAATINPPTPLQFYTEVTFEPLADGTGGTMQLSMQPLALDQGQVTTPRTPIGDKLEIADVMVDGSGAFMVVATEDLMVPGAANPITGGDIVVQDLVLTGSIQNEDIMCGSVTGLVTAPIMLDLAGSTFAAERVTAIDMLPTTVLGACPKGGVGESGGSEAGGSESGGSDGGDTTGG